MKTLKWALAAMTLSLVAACGGGGKNAGTSPFGSGGCSRGVGCLGPPVARRASKRRRARQLGPGRQRRRHGDDLRHGQGFDTTSALAGIAGHLHATTTAATSPPPAPSPTPPAWRPRRSRPAPTGQSPGDGHRQVRLGQRHGRARRRRHRASVLRRHDRAPERRGDLPIKAVDSRGTPIAAFPVTVTNANGVGAGRLVTDRWVRPRWLRRHQRRRRHADVHRAGYVVRP